MYISYMVDLYSGEDRMFTTSITFKTLIRNFESEFMPLLQ